MRIVEFVLQRKGFFTLLMLLTVLGGVYSYLRLGRLEYPNFTIKKALIVTKYKGATAKEVEEEVTDKIEEEVQKMSQIDNITSISRAGLSVIYVEIRMEFRSSAMPQIWDELRRKVHDITTKLPEGAGTPKVWDDFGDVYGIFFALSGDGYTADELKDYADILKKEFLRVPNVAKVDFWGVQEKIVYVEFNRAKLATLGISHDKLFATLNQNNKIVESGQLAVDGEYPFFRVSGNIDGVEAIQNLYIADSHGKLLRLGDIADVRRGHLEPPERIMRRNGKEAVGIGISIVDGGNVVDLGRAVRKLLNDLAPERPAGMTLSPINYQSDDVERSLNEFLINLAESVAIVVGILLLTMGWRSGVIIGITLLLIILGTFIGMDLAKIDMQLISLGALIIALGMLVDNAIVIVDGFLVKTQRGMPREKAVAEAALETQWPLLGATVVAILAFLAIGFNPGNIGDFCSSLFFVIMISLLLSWIMALIFTPLLCLWIFPKQSAVATSEEVYVGRIYDFYREILRFCLRWRKTTVLILIALLGAALYCNRFVPKTFFPYSTRTQFYIDYWGNPANHIEATARDVEKIAQYLRSLDGVVSVTEFIGEGTLRYVLTYDYNSQSPDYGQLVVEVNDSAKIVTLIPKIETWLEQNMPNANPLVQRYAEGTPIPFKVEARFQGPDEKILRNLAEQAKAVMRRNPNAKYVRDDWRDPVKNIRLHYSDAKARQTGISRQEFANAVQWNFNGIKSGVLREKNELISIISRPVASERKSLSDLGGVQIYSSAAGRSYPLGLACEVVESDWEHPQIRHRDRIPAITVQCSPRSGTAVELQKELEKELKAIRLPPLYKLEWGGEKYQSQIAQAGLKKLFPVSLILMFVVIALLFRTIREAVIAFAVLPFALIGVVGGLLMLHLPFGFMAILGFLGLSGMLLKNAIVLLDQINLEISHGIGRFEAVINASVSRLRPVSMAAGTTIFGVFPLLTHVFFDSMAATIMFGLIGATVLTLLAVPVLYALFFGLPSDGAAQLKNASSLPADRKRVEEDD
ncbi:MAG: efflux RND transporter permease subunit [Victivallaceae bacterium]|nr:efflux RND transporter permease subunit [Victivallaceae bacterium]